jgi:hypothetical protein
VAGLAVALYFAYRNFQHFQPSDVAPHQAAAGDAQSRGMAATPGKPIAAPAAATPGAAPDSVVKADAASAVPKSDQGAAGVSQPKAAGAAEPRARSEQVNDLFGIPPARVPPPTDVATRPGPDQQRAARPVQAMPGASAAGSGVGAAPDQSSKAGAGSVQRPNTPCSDALAALGLCTRDSNQGRKP